MLIVGGLNKFDMASERVFFAHHFTIVLRNIEAEIASEISVGVETSTAMPKAVHHNHFIYLHASDTLASLSILI